MEEMHRARHGERARSFHALSKCTTVPKSPCGHQSGSCLSFCFFVEASLPRHDCLNHSPLVTELNLQPSSPPRRRGGETEVSNHLITGLVPLAVSPHPQVTQGHFINIIQDTFNHLGNSKGFVPGMGTKTKYIFLIRSHNITGTKQDDWSLVTLFSDCPLELPGEF